MKTCTVTGCERPSRARGMCDTHYRRARRNGSPTIAYKPWERVKAEGRRHLPGLGPHEEVAFLIGGGVPVQEALDRVGITAEAVMRWATRHGWHRLAGEVRPAYNAHKRAEAA